MKYVHIDAVEPGQILGKTIFSSNGTVLLSEGVQLTVFMINTLNRIGATMLFIKDPNLEDVEIIDIVSEETKRNVMQKMTEMYDQLKSGKEFNTKHISVSADTLIDEIMRNKEVLVQLSDIRTKDNEYFVHALNVCMMSTLVGINMNLNQGQLKELATGALLHDIGKVGQEDGEEGIGREHHTWKGFEILKNKREFNLLIAHCAFQHHEALDGTGQPRGLAAGEIHLYAQIVAVANLYDNLLFNKQQDKRMLPHEACEHLMALSGTLLDHDVLVNFLRTVSIYPTGTSVRLSTREIGVVVGQHRGLPGRPIVRIVKQEDEKEFTVKEVDMAKQTTVFIESVLS